MDWYFTRYEEDAIVPVNQPASDQLWEQEALFTEFSPRQELLTTEKSKHLSQNCGASVRDLSIKQPHLWDQAEYHLQQRLCQPWPNYTEEYTFDYFAQEEVQHGLEESHHLDDLSIGIQSFSDIWNDESMNWSAEMQWDSQTESLFTDEVPMLSTLDHTESSTPNSEESALHDLQFVLEQLSKETRICFRDTLYRFAKNSKRTSDGKESRLDEFDMNISSLAEEKDRNSRSSQRTRSSDTQTAVIDTTITSLLFGSIMVTGPDSPESEATG